MNVGSISAKTNWTISDRHFLLNNVTSRSTHSDVPSYIFRGTETTNSLPDKDYQSLSETSLERQLIKNTTKFFANFAKFG